MRLDSSGRKLIAVGVLIGLIALLFFMGSRTENPSSKRELYFPWRIEVLPNGSSRVFGITLGKSTLGTVQRLFRDTGDIKLFVSSEGGLSLEAFFKSVDLNGIRGKFVLGLSLEEKTMTAMLERGLRVKSMGSDGTRRVTLHPTDLAHIEYAPVMTITYLPGTDLDETILVKRFGEPSIQVPEQEQEGVVHWFYPHLGLDIALNRNGKEVFQYVAPREFDRLRKGF
uniref:Uncharacterized protein n=1 Tax=Candidatus Kentrum sp. MB TaxID=2138164 RepID=A0A450XAK8_9GAMM|nr:MAG: hypothetical protein BECKMB1821G_GA0114241_102033 [Candidatus Kentron sp. MB]